MEPPGSRLPALPRGVRPLLNELCDRLFVGLTPCLWIPGSLELLGRNLEVLLSSVTSNMTLWTREGPSP